MPSWAICFSPKMTDRIATSDMAALDEIEPACIRVLVFGQDDRAEDQQQRHHRQGEEEYRSPTRTARA